MSLSMSTKRLLWEYRKLKGDMDEKYARYLGKLQNSNRVHAKTLLRAFELLETSNSRFARKLAEDLKRRRVVVVFDNLGSNKGQLYDKGNFLRGRYNDGVIVIDTSYGRNALGVAAILAHEYCHIRDYELTKAKRLDIGIYVNPDSHDAQLRADIYAGRILHELGYRIDIHLQREQFDNLKKAWGDKWSLNIGEQNHKLTKYKDFMGLSTEEKAKLQKRWGIPSNQCNGFNHKPGCNCGFGGRRRMKSSRP